MDTIRRRGWISSAVVFFVGLAVGGGAVESYHVVHDKTTAEVFSRRLRCDELANEFVKKESSDTESVSLELMGYSTASNSCVGYLTDGNQRFPNHIEREWRVVDLLSHEVFYSDWCRVEKADPERYWCGDGRDMTLGRRGEAAFRQAMNGQEIDVEKIK
jgi:hypothetical protein